jgi:hypothetical protein
MLHKQNSTQDKPVAVSVLTPAFVTEKANKRAATNAVAIPQAKDIDIREEQYVIRSALLMGEHVPIYIGDDVVAQIRKPLLKITSTTIDEIHKNSVIKLPKNTEKGGVIRLVEYLTYVVRTTKKPAPMRKAIPTFDALSVCAAAKLLGMEKYVEHVYKAMDYHLHQHTPTYEDIDAVLAFKEQHARLYKLVVNDLAILVWEEKIPDPEQFDKYLRQNPMLQIAIDAANDAYAKKLRMDEEREEQRIRQKKYEQRNTALAKEQEQRDKARWAAKNAKRALMEKSCREKSQGPVEKRKKFDADERSYWIQSRGVPPPKGC